MSDGGRWVRQVLLGDSRGPFSPPGQLTQETYQRLRQWAGQEVPLLEEAYARDDNSVPPQLVYTADRSATQNRHTGRGTHTTAITQNAAKFNPRRHGGGGS